VDLRVGDIVVTPLHDGEFRTGPEYFGPEVTFDGHEDLLGTDGRLHLPIGCFLLRGGPLADRRVLVDAGLGEMSADNVDGGALMDELARAGVRPSEIDTVVCSHLHIDHCGWLMDAEARPIFPAATVAIGAEDWERFVESGQDLMLEHTRSGLKELFGAERVTLVDRDGPVAPGVSAIRAPGHTPGHLVLIVSDGDSRALLLGDAISCPVQLEETDWAAISDVDPALARATRERLWRELDDTRMPAVGAHFPGLEFGRVLSGAGRRWV
jgi:glyoxylase-like metal-dependent hydrolase (beta-lactamase superfamily II)